MKVLLQKDVKNLGKVGDLVNVSLGFARNYLFPRLLAMEATEKRVKEFAHLHMVADGKRKKALAERQDVVKKLSGVSLTFKMPAGDTDKLFGSVTNNDVSNELEKHGYSIDRRDIHLEEPIKILGSHKAIVRLGDGLEAEIAISVERQ